MIKSKGVAIGLFVALSLAGMAGNYFKYPIFFSIDFIFGSLFSMFVLQLLGSRAGIFSAVLVAGITYFLWNHPYAILIGTGEAVVVAWLYYRRRMDFVLADALYWGLLGMPLVLLFYYGVMHLPFDTASITMLKQAVNGVTNALIARTAFLLLGYRSRQIEVSMRELIFNGLFMFVLFPSLFLMATESRRERDDVDRQLREALTITAAKTNANVDIWLHEHLDQVTYIARLASTHRGTYMQTVIEQAQAADADFLRIGLMNDKAIAVAFSPLVDDLGKSSLGRDFSDRPYVAELRLALKPMLGEVVLGKVGVPKPITSALAPVVVQGRYAGYVAGVLNLDKLEAFVAQNARNPNMEQLNYSLLDQKRRVIISNKAGIKSMDVFAREKGEVIPIQEGLVQWFPEKKRNISISEKWKDAVYISETRVGKLANWTLILEVPVKPYQIRMYEKYSGLLWRLVVILLLALILARTLSNMIMRSFEKLRVATLDLPERLALNQPIAWEHSMMLEAQQMLDNFQQMAQSLSSQFNKVKDMNAQLELRVMERTNALKQSEERWKFAVEGSGDGVWDWDIPHGTIALSRRWYEIQGFAAGSVADIKAWRALIHPDDAARVEAALESHFKEGTPLFSCEHRIRCSNGEYKWILGRGMVVSRDHGGRPLRVIGTHSDITERKQAEQELRALKDELEVRVRQRTAQLEAEIRQRAAAQAALQESEARFRAITTLNPDHLVMQDRELRYTFVMNPQLGLTEQDMLGKTDHDILAQDEAESLTALKRQILASGEPRHVEISLAAKDGTMNYFDGTYIPELDAEGKADALIGYFRNVTERKHNEEQIEHLNAELQRRAQDLEAANGELEAFSYSVSHDLRAPLRAIDGFAHILLDDHADKLDDEGKRLLNTVRDNADRMRQLIDDILAFSRSGRTAIMYSSIDMEKLAREVVAELQQAVEHGQLEMEVDPIPPSAGDRAMMRQVFVNLLSNAMKFTRTRAVARIRVGGRIEKDEVIYFVQDNGVGFDMRYADKLFGVFQRLHGVSEFEGTGIGLAIVKRIVTRHGGRVWAEGKLNEGATLYFALPAEHH